MGLRAFAVALVIGFPLVVGTACSAATIKPVQGQLSLNQGQGFLPVNGRINAQVGDSVMVSPNGAAIVSYSDGCKVNVQPGAVTTIAPISPCAAGSYAQDEDDDRYDNPALWGFGALAAGGAGFLIYEITQNRTTHPASP